MKIYISGISGTGMGPLALMAHDAGYQVFGSDLQEGLVTTELRQHDIPFRLGPQDGSFLQQVHAQTPIDWFVYTSALPDDHPELTTARQLGLKISKRDQLIAHLVDQLGLKMVAVAGTHGKTTTTSMLIWGAQQLHLPAAYLVGTTLPFAPAGRYQKGDQFFIYEADEYDRNFLHFHPWLSLIPSISYDHPDIYPTEADYRAAFDQFQAQSQTVITPSSSTFSPDDFSLAGPARRLDAALAATALATMLRVEPSNRRPVPGNNELIVRTLDAFPGPGRRFERLAPGVYTDYAHHPEEISATLEIAREEAARQGLKGIVAIYQPHQNTRQHQVRAGYRAAFSVPASADPSHPALTQLFWLPTYLTREDPTLPVLTPADFLADLDLPAGVAHIAEDLSAISDQLRTLHDQGHLILLMTAGPADATFRQLFAPTH